MSLSDADLVSFVELVRQAIDRPEAHVPAMNSYLKLFLQAAGFSRVRAVQRRTVSVTLDSAKASDPTRSTTNPFAGSPFVALDREGPDGEVLALSSGWLARMINVVRKYPDFHAAKHLREHVLNAERRARPLVFSDGSTLEWRHPWQDGVELGVAGRGEPLIEWDVELRNPVVGRHSSCGGDLTLLGDTLTCSGCQWSTTLHSHPRTPRQLEKAFA